MKREALDHPKTKHLEEILGGNRLEALGLLEGLWGFAGKWYPGGRIPAAHFPRFARWMSATSRESELLEALLEAGFLELEGDDLVVHDWLDHCDRHVRRRISGDKWASGPKRSAPVRADDAPNRASSRRRGVPPPEPEPEPEPEPSRSQSRKREAGSRPRDLFPVPPPAKPKRWKRVPEGEELTPKRLEYAQGRGLDQETARDQWERFVDWQFRDYRTDVDATWRTWVRRAADNFAGRGGRPSGGAPSSMTAAEKSHEAARRVLERRGALPR